MWKTESVAFAVALWSVLWAVLLRRRMLGQLAPDGLQRHSIHALHRVPPITHLTASERLAPY
jgi:hypothetical protein